MVVEFFGGSASNISLIPFDIPWLHVSAISNGNLNSWNSFSNTDKETLLQVPKQSGYRFVLESIQFPEVWTIGSEILISTSWSNIGVAPLYDNWNLVFQLRYKNNTIWTCNSTFKLAFFLPTQVTKITC